MSASVRGGFGIHSLLAMRDALLARHVARFMLYPDSLWAATMRLRYGLVSQAEDYHPSLRCSTIWKAMVAIAHVVSPHIRWILKDGRVISLLHDP